MNLEKGKFMQYVQNRDAENPECCILVGCSCGNCVFLFVDDSDLDLFKR